MYIASRPKMLATLNSSQARNVPASTDGDFSSMTYSAATVSADDDRRGAVSHGERSMTLGHAHQQTLAAVLRAPSSSAASAISASVKREFVPFGIALRLAASAFGGGRVWLDSGRLGWLAASALRVDLAISRSLGLWLQRAGMLHRAPDPSTLEAAWVSGERTSTLSSPSSSALATA